MKRKNRTATRRVTHGTGHRRLAYGIGDSVGRKRTLAIENLEQRLPLAVFLVTNTGDAGPGSFRQAIFDSNSSFGTDEIRFAIGTGPASITPATALPDLTDTVLIDGSTQPGFDGKPLIELDGRFVTGFSHGLALLANNITIRSIVIGGFNADGLSIHSDGNTIEGCYIGTDLSGTLSRSNGAGWSNIGINGNNNMIGGYSPTQRNVISGSPNSQGVWIASGSVGGKVVGNFVGTTADGRSALPNLGGIYDHETSDTLVAGNVLSGIFMLAYLFSQQWDRVSQTILLVLTSRGKMQFQTEVGSTSTLVPKQVLLTRILSLETAHLVFASIDPRMIRW